MYLIDFTTMCVAFSLRNQMIYRQYICAYIFGNIKMFYDMFDFVHTRMVMVVVMLMMMVVMLVFVVLMVVVMFMMVVVFVHMLVLMFTVYL